MNMGFVPLTADAIPPEAPPGWKWRELKKIARLESGHTPSRYRPEWWGGDIPWIALPDIRALDGMVAQATLEYTNSGGIANSAARVLPKGTVVLSRTASVGFVTIMGRPMATSQDFANWVCGPELVPEFLLYLLMASREYVRSLASGAVHKTVYMPTLEAFQVCIPDVDEQIRVVTRLRKQQDIIRQADAFAAARGAASRLIGARMLREAFLDTVPLTVEATPDEAPPGWEWRELRKLARTESGHTPSRSSPEWWGGDIPWIGLADIRALDGKVAMATKEAITPQGEENSAARRLPKGTVVMCRDASIGLVTMMGREMATSQHFANWVCGPDLDAEFLMYLIMASREYITTLASGSVIQTVYRHVSDAFQVCIPPVTEQRAIAASLRRRLALAEQLVHASSIEQESIDSLSSAVLREAFTGAHI